MQFDPQKIRTSIRNAMEEYPTILLNGSKFQLLPFSFLFVHAFPSLKPDTLTELEAKVNVPKEFLIFGVGILAGIVLFAFGGASLLMFVPRPLFLFPFSFIKEQVSSKTDP